MVHGSGVNAAAHLALALSLPGTLTRTLTRLAAPELLAMAGRAGMLLARALPLPVLSGVLLAGMRLSGMLLSRLLLP
jgi:hypothetical protein